jgi:hypothetical protein
MVAASGARSNVEAHLREDLGFPEGLATPVRGQALANWLTDAGVDEDNFPRFLNHFHNPLASNWSDAGLGGSVGQSAILWAQMPDGSDRLLGPNRGLPYRGFIIDSYTNAPLAGAEVVPLRIRERL